MKEFYQKYLNSPLYLVRLPEGFELDDMIPKTIVYLISIVKSLVI